MSLWSVLLLRPLATMSSRLTRSRSKAYFEKVRRQEVQEEIQKYEHRWTKERLRRKCSESKFEFTIWALEQMPENTRYREERKRFTTISKVFQYLNRKKRLNLGRLVCLKKCVRSCAQPCCDTSNYKTLFNTTESYFFDEKPDVRYCCLGHLFNNEKIIMEVATERDYGSLFEPPSVRFKLRELVNEPLSCHKLSNQVFRNVAQAMKFYERIVGFEGRNYWGKTCKHCGKSRKNAKKFFKFTTRRDNVETNRFYCGDNCLIGGLLEVSRYVT